MVVLFGLYLYLSVCVWVDYFSADDFRLIWIILCISCASIGPTKLHNDVSYSKQSRSGRKTIFDIHHSLYILFLAFVLPFVHNVPYHAWTNVQFCPLALSILDPFFFCAWSDLLKISAEKILHIRDAVNLVFRSFYHSIWSHQRVPHLQKKW